MSEDPATSITCDFSSVDIPENTSGIDSIKSSLVLEQAADIFVKKGCLIIKNAFDPAYIQELHDSYIATNKKYFNYKKAPGALWVGDHRIMITVDIKGSFNSHKLYANPKVFPLLKYLLGEEAIIGGLTSVASLPGAKHQGRHLDHPILFDRHLGDDCVALLPPYAITVNIPLIPITETTGCTRMWPGSHLLKVPQEPQEPYVDPILNLGDCMLIDYRLFHQGIANNSESVRPIMTEIYHRPWFRDTDNYQRQKPLKLSDKEYKKIPFEYKHLFAWWKDPDGWTRLKSSNSVYDIDSFGRNDPCYCGSGKKYKKCHGA